LGYVVGAGVETGAAGADAGGAGTGGAGSAEGAGGAVGGTVGDADAGGADGAGDGVPVAGAVQEMVYPTAMIDTGTSKSLGSLISG
jgi:hypothetical protein